MRETFGAAGARIDSWEAIVVGAMVSPDGVDCLIMPVVKRRGGVTAGDSGWLVRARARVVRGWRVVMP